ncbi:MAG: PQQ-binding-like beta-propeller repeat protein [Phycisphaerae bacterium]|nr:PQQ-binding-like beta-propeller repeat protein [Phycisphaerae bacterium]
MTVSLWFASVRADDWPQWRGPSRDGQWNEIGLIESFASKEPTPLWRVPIGPGYSGPVVANGRVFVADHVYDPEESERIHCFDADSGKPLWSYRYPCKYRNIQYLAGPRAAMLIHQGRAFSLGTMGHLFCLDSATGQVLWQKDLQTEYRLRIPTWGIAPSPMIESHTLIVLAGGRDGAAVIAFDQATGKEVWRALDDPIGYSAPIVIDHGGKRLIVCWTGTRVVGLEPETGKMIWEYPYKHSRMVINMPTPVVKDDYLFVSGFYDGSLLLKLNPDRTVRCVWRRFGPSEQDTDALHCCISTPLMLGEHIYGVDTYGQFRCLDRKTGDRIWEDSTAVPGARWANIHFTQNGPTTWMFNERGELIIANLSPQGFKEISRAKIIEPTMVQLDQRGGVCWSHPAFANRRVYARNDRELVCVDLAKK